MLVSDNPDRPTQAHCVLGTEAQIEAAARRLAARTRGCVTICVVVAEYHVSTCETMPRRAGVVYREH